MGSPVWAWTTPPQRGLRMQQTQAPAASAAGHLLSFLLRNRRGRAAWGSQRVDWMVRQFKGYFTPDDNVAGRQQPFDIPASGGGIKSRDMGDSIKSARRRRAPPDAARAECSSPSDQFRFAARRATTPHPLGNGGPAIGNCLPLASNTSNVWSSRIRFAASSLTQGWSRTFSPARRFPPRLKAGIGKQQVAAAWRFVEIPSGGRFVDEGAHHASLAVRGVRRRRPGGKGRP